MAREIKFRAWDEQQQKMIYNFNNTSRTAELNENGFIPTPSFLTPISK